HGPTTRDIHRPDKIRINWESTSFYFRRIVKRSPVSSTVNPGIISTNLLQMGIPDIVDFARNFSVLVRVQGPDPKGLKMRRHAFHQYHSGITTLSASGVLLSDALFDADVAKRILGDGGHNLMLAITVASVVEPFLSLQHRVNISQDQPKLIPGAQIDIMAEGNVRSEIDTDSLDNMAPSWVTGRLIKLVDVPVSSLAIQSLVEAGSLEHGWEVGWSLASYDSSSQPLMDVIQTRVEHENESFMENQRHLGVRESINPSVLGKSTTRIAVIGLFSLSKDLPNIAISPSYKRGDFLLAVGSPFGVLSPLHFFNSVSMGSVANCYPPGSSHKSLLMADIRCLPGMEGGPLFGEHEHFIGVLTRPLRQKNSDAEVQLVIPWEAIATACSDLLLKEPQSAKKGLHINKGNLKAVGIASLNSHNSNRPFSYKHEDHGTCCPSPLPVEKATSSICLITIDDGVWASGVLLNDRGLILTNAHLLEPWRFGKANGNAGRKGNKSDSLFFLSEESASPRHSAVDGYQKSQSLLPKASRIVVADEHRENKLSLSYNGQKNIRVRLDHLDPWIWCDAKIVFVCNGPLDVALLQLEYVPDQICPINVTFAYPPLGSMAYVIGHGLFGPQSGFSPSVCSGVVAKIVNGKMPPQRQRVLQGVSQLPVMLETTAAVHPGGSGGAVVNSNGHMIGLVTSNARHGGGRLIPHLNFSIPCAVLAPIFEFARDMQDFSLLQNLDLPNEHLSLVWALMPPLSPKPDRPLPNLPPFPLDDHNKAGKGSRFAKFIAERGELLTRPEDNNKEGKGSRFSKFLAGRDEALKRSPQLGTAGKLSNKSFHCKL
ncbi:Trypsin_2 domain-containing protein, partial [Cephalotus follicularis]